MEQSLGQKITTLRIYGDNILECERAMFLIADAFAASTRLLDSPPYAPQYKILIGMETIFTIQLLPGHGRWGVNLQERLVQSGAPLHEATDAVITKLLPDIEQEEILLALEFCNALPAGNNAWQRNGRALPCLVLGIPYLYFAEVGGLELGPNRKLKAARFPSPIVPFSYLNASRLFNSICLPVYSPGPTVSEVLREQLGDIFGFEEAKELIRSILKGTSTKEMTERLNQKVLNLVNFLVKQRRVRTGVFNNDEWNIFLRLNTTSQKLKWLEGHRDRWTKKTAKKVRVTDTSRQVFKILQEVGKSVGVSDIPICLVPTELRKALSSKLDAIYNRSIRGEFLQWIANSHGALIVVWITGFKPKGEDSRPDRGLVPLARMLFGNAADILTIVSGPAQKGTWSLIKKSPHELAKRNGLWESILQLSDAILVDSTTSPYGPIEILTDRTRKASASKLALPMATKVANFSEHDVDTVLHLLFTAGDKQKVFESMCNPPGGDWSGMSLLNFSNGTEYRWTSLPRVTSKGSKRPDHVIQIYYENTNYLLAIESKNRASDLEANVGDRLKRYVIELMANQPTAIRTHADGNWSLYSQELHMVNLSNCVYLSGVAFCWSGEEVLQRAFKEGNVDIAFALEFRDEKDVLIHLKFSRGAARLMPIIVQPVKDFLGRLKIQVH